MSTARDVDDNELLITVALVQIRDQRKADILAGVHHLDREEWCNRIETLLGQIRQGEGSDPATDWIEVGALAIGGWSEDPSNQE